jgi:hypothetical protein
MNKRDTALTPSQSAEVLHSEPRQVISLTARLPRSCVMLWNSIMLYLAFTGGLAIGFVLGAVWASRER